MPPAFPLRGQESRQKQVVIGHRGHSEIKYARRRNIEPLLLHITTEKIYRDDSDKMNDTNGSPKRILPPRFMGSIAAGMSHRTFAH